VELADIIFFVVGFFSVVGTMAGFGSSTIFLPLASCFVDFKTALVLVAIFHFFGNIGRITFFRHGLDIVSEHEKLPKGKVFNFTKLFILAKKPELCLKPPRSNTTLEPTNTQQN
jgi:hypothetical protein